MRKLIVAWSRILIVFAAVMVMFTCVLGQQTTTGERKPGGGNRGEGRRGNGEGGKRGDGGGNTFQTTVPEHPWDIVAGRQTRNSITLSILAYSDIDGSILYGTESGKYVLETPVTKFRRGQPAEVVLSGLRPNTRYFYAFRSRAAGSARSDDGPELSFSTARPAGTDFTFAIQADSHLDEGIDTATYQRSLGNIADARPDFMVDLGDTFMTDKWAEFAQSEAQYLAQRYYLGYANRSVPLYLTLGNHDGEAGWRRSGGSGGIFDWSNSMRRRYFPNPVPGDFFGGDRTPDKRYGDLQDYYSWEWGDALFVVLDPFTFTTERSHGEDNWGWTLGTEQYKWLKQTLEGSKAKYKFVFIHHLVGGVDRVARGGVEAAQLFEWGGKSFDGNDEFRSKRPEMAMPIHQLFVKNGVSAVFHGHDHLYVKQELDGIIYQEVPQPGHSRVDNTRSAAEYGYKQGDIRGSSGVLIVRISSRSARVSYVRAFPEGREGNGRKNGLVDTEYEIFGKTR